MIGFEDNKQDWSELSLESQKLQKQRDQLLNDKKFKKAFSKHMQVEEANLKLTHWFITNSK